jgi:protein TonB
VAATVLLASCQKSEPIPTTADRLKYVEQKQQVEPEFYAPRKIVDYMSDLKSIKENAPKTAPAPTANAPASAAPAAARAAPPESKPAIVESKSAPPPAPAAVAAPVQTAATQSAAASNVVASAQPTARPTPASESAASVTVISRAQPEFPKEAARAGIESGNVSARMVIDATGNVSNVVILEANPPRRFDRAVVDALSRWKFNAGVEGRTYETSIAFKL